MYTTLNQILDHNPCGQELDEDGNRTGWLKLLAYLGKDKPDDEPLSIETILESNGLNDALWALRAVDGYNREKRLLACDFAQHVAHLYRKKYPDDTRVDDCIEMARRYANDEANDKELTIARVAVCSALAAPRTAKVAEMAAAGAAAHAVEAAAWAAEAAKAVAEAAEAATWVSGNDGACAAALSAEEAVKCATAGAAAEAAEWAAAYAVEVAVRAAGEMECRWQEQHLRECLTALEEK